MEVTQWWLGEALTSPISHSYLSNCPCLPTGFLFAKLHPIRQFSHISVGGWRLNVRFSFKRLGWLNCWAYSFTLSVASWQVIWHQGQMTQPTAEFSWLTNVDATNKCSLSVPRFGVVDKSLHCPSCSNCWLINHARCSDCLVRTLASFLLINKAMRHQLSKWFSWG